MEKITQRALLKSVNIIEILMEVLNCSYTQAYVIVRKSNIFKSFNEGDKAALYQSAPCCIEDIGKELILRDSSFAKYFSQENINKSINTIRKRNESMQQKFKVM